MRPGTPVNTVGGVGIPAMPGKGQHGRRGCHWILVALGLGEDGDIC